MRSELPGVVPRRWRGLVGRPFSKHWRAGLLVLLMGAVMAWSLVPMLWFLMVAFSEPGFIPTSIGISRKLSLDSFRGALIGGRRTAGGLQAPIAPAIGNSFIVATGTVALVLALSIGAAYVFSRVRFRGKGVLYQSFLVVRATPSMSLAVPVYLLLLSYRLLNTKLGLVLVHTIAALPLAVWLIKGFMDTVPPELEEQAMIDGASVSKTLRLITLPLAAPGIAVAACFVFLASYIEYQYALIINRGDVITLPLAIRGYMSEHEVFWNEMAAATFVSMIPLALFFSFVGRYIVRGLTLGALK